MCRLIWGFAGRTYHIAGNLVSRLILCASDLSFTIYNHFQFSEKWESYFQCGTNFQWTFRVVLVQISRLYLKIFSYFYDLFGLLSSMWMKRRSTWSCKDPEYLETLDLPVRSGSTMLASLPMVDTSWHKSMQNFSACKEFKYSGLHYTVELQWLELWRLIHLGWLELSSWSQQVILCLFHPGWLELPLARTFFPWSQTCSSHWSSTVNTIQEKSIYWYILCLGIRGLHINVDVIFIFIASNFCFNKNML